MLKSTVWRGGGCYMCVVFTYSISIVHWYSLYSNHIFTNDVYITAFHIGSCYMLYYYFHCIIYTCVKEEGGVKIDSFGPRSAECDENSE